MRRAALMLFVLSSLCWPALAHPGHDAPEPHFHALWEALLLVALIAVWLVIRIAKLKSSQRRSIQPIGPGCNR